MSMCVAASMGVSVGCALADQRKHALGSDKGKFVLATDVNGPMQKDLIWSEKEARFVLKGRKTDSNNDAEEKLWQMAVHQMEYLRHAFIPEDVTPDYYSFSAWRFVQRCISSTVGVFGTQALLLALGIKAGRIGRAATVSWVLKDGLGRLGKMVWAGGKGKDFDVDPKRWRFRSALMYSLGNGLEIVTQIFPASFVVLASLATMLKQTSMLTASATRNAMYRSFGGIRNNIGNITAKGEAQIVVADLIGMACGIRLSRWVGTDKSRVLMLYVLLSALDIAAIYQELRQVVFRTLNPERACLLVRHFLSSTRTGQILAPSEVNKVERIFLPPVHCPWGTFTYVSRVVSTPTELETVMRVFRNEKFLLNYVDSNKSDARAQDETGVSSPKNDPASAVVSPARAAASSSSASKIKIVLRTDARSPDVMKALLARAYLYKLLRAEERDRQAHTQAGAETQRLRRLTAALKSANRSIGDFKNAAAQAGWSVEHMVFSVAQRGSW